MFEQAHTAAATPPLRSSSLAKQKVTEEQTCQGGMEAVVRAALDEHRRRKSAARTGATEGKTGTGNQEEHAMEYEAIRNKNNTRRKGIKTKNGVLVTVESERCAPSAVWMVKRAASAAMGESMTAMRSEGGDDGQKWCQRIGANGIVVTHLYRLVAMRGATGAWQAIAELLGRGSSSRSETTYELVIVCGVTRPGSSARGPVHDEDALVARLSSWLIEESAIVMRVHAPRMDHSQGTEVLATLTTAPSRASVYVLRFFPQTCAPEFPVASVLCIQMRSTVSVASPSFYESEEVR